MRRDSISYSCIRETIRDDTRLNVYILIWDLELLIVPTFESLGPLIHRLLDYYYQTAPVASTVGDLGGYGCIPIGPTTMQWEDVKLKLSKTKMEDCCIWAVGPFTFFSTQFLFIIMRTFTQIEKLFWSQSHSLVWNLFYCVRVTKNLLAAVLLFVTIDKPKSSS
jgi:hypothetical protein